jgi:signal transduction histidine kinase
MDEKFIRNRLFKPFDSTKGSKGMGIGVYQARDFARAAGGDLTVSSVPNEGTRFRFILPKYDEAGIAVKSIHLSANK